MNTTIVVSHSKDIQTWVAENHYLESCPWGNSLQLWCYINDKRVGAMIWSKPVAKGIDQVHILELRRMFIIDDTPSFVESQFLGLARQYIRNNMPDITGLVSYSSTGMKHKGIIYQADNWCCMGITKSSSKGFSSASRERKTYADPSDKIKWMRSP